MEKTAQKRSILNKLREMTNVSGIAAEKFFNPEFKRVMESLREKDDEIRSLVAGTVIGAGDPGSDPVALKDIIKSVRSSLNRREYMLAVSDLGRFHKKVSEIAQKISTLNFDIDKVHHQFLFGSEEEPVLTDEHKERLQYLKNRFAQEQNILIKQAGIMDFFYNIGTKRGRALAAWEKRYPEKAKPLAKQTAAMLVQSENLLERTLSALKEMASARAVRNIDTYMKAASGITKLYDKYHKAFENYYRGVVQPLIKDMDLAPAPTTPVPDTIVTPLTGPTGTIPGSPVPGALVPPVPAVSPTPQTPIPLTVDDPNAAPVTLKSGPPTPMTPPPAGIPGPQIPPAPPMSVHPRMPWNPAVKASYQEFIDSLESLSQEDPLVLAAHITRYARSIESIDPSTAINLFKIVQSIKR